VSTPPDGAVPFARLAAEVRSAPARLGPVRLVCVDGPAGSGKTTFAGRLAAALGDPAGLVHMDDLYAGWTMTGSAARLAAGVLAPLAQGRPGGYHRYDWPAGRFAADVTTVPLADVLVVEGCGSCRRALDPFTTLRVWVEAPTGLRLARGLDRDGAAMADAWHRWQRTEAELFAAEATRDRADLRVDGTAGTGPTAFVPLTPIPADGPQSR
jgi:uridine kinase